MSEDAPGVPSGGERTLADVAKVRQEIGLPAHGAPDDRYTVSILQADRIDIYGMSAHGTAIVYRVNAISASHAQTDALNQLVQLRRRTGATGGTARLVVDRRPCPACDTFGGIRAGVRAAGLDSLDVIFPGGSLIVTP